VTSQPWPFPASLMIGCQGEALDTSITLDPKELQDACWVSREDLMHALAGLDPAMKPARQGSIARALMDGWVSGRLE
jgi:NAD+ diphosphatase